MNKGKKAAMYIFLVIISLFSVFPLYYMACAATNKSVDVSRGRLIPGYIPAGELSDPDRESGSLPGIMEFLPKCSSTHILVSADLLLSWIRI